MCNCGEIWMSESRLSRAERCKTWLAAEGFLTPKENLDVGFRIRKAIEVQLTADPEATGA